MEIRAELEELEKRIATLRKTAALAEDLLATKTDVQDLLTRLLNLEQYYEQTDKNTEDINTLIANLTSAVEKITNLETSLANTQESLQETENNLALIQTSINGINSELDLFDSSLTTVNGKIASLEESASNISQSFETLKTDFENLDVAIKQVEADMTSLETSVSYIKTDIDTLNYKMNNIDVKLQGYDETFNNYENRIQQVENSVSENNRTVASMVTTTSGLSIEIDDLKESVKSINANIENIEVVVSSIYAQIDSINSRITSIEGNLSNYQSSIDALSGTIDEHSTKINEINSSLEQNTSQIAELNSNITQISTQVSGYDSIINDLTNTVSECEQNVLAVQKTVEGMDNRVTNLENNEVVETFNMGEEGTFNLGVKDVTQNSAYIFFRCEPTAKIKMHVDLKFSNFPTDITRTEFHVYYDNNILIKNYVFTEGFKEDMTLSFDFSFFPKKNNYRIRIMSADAETANAIMESMTVSIEGRNIMILNRHHDIHLHVLSDKYYLTKQISNKGYYCEQTSLNLDEEGTEIDNFSKMNFVYKFYKHTIFQASTQTWRDVTTKYVVVLSNGSEYKLGVQTVGGSTTTWRGSYMNDGYYTYKSGSTAYLLCGTTLDGLAKIAPNSQFNSTDSSKYTITLNGVPLEEKYIQCMPVYDHYLTTRTDTNTAGYILQDNDGKIYYLPDQHATYIIYLGRGTQINAYLQADNTTINVYYTFCNSLIKRVLTKNAEGIFELSPEITKTPGVTEYIEGINGESIQKIDGVYTVVQTTWQFLNLWYTKQKG